MENAAKEHELKVSVKTILDEEEELYGLFEDVFGEDSADDMPETADAIDSYLLSELRHCGKQVDASKVADIMSAILIMRKAEERFHEADKAVPDDLDAWRESHFYAE